METLVTIDSERAFYYAYQSHVTSDEYEEHLGATVASMASDYALEFYVDRMLIS